MLVNLLSRKEIVEKVVSAAIAEATPAPGRPARILCYITYPGSQWVQILLEYGVCFVCGTEQFQALSGWQNRGLHSYNCAEPKASSVCNTPILVNKEWLFNLLREKVGTVKAYRVYEGAQPKIMHRVEAAQSSNYSVASPPRPAGGMDAIHRVALLSVEREGN